jgi:DHA2 family metal-tetracycline-proton antiporter-like MFS transporter
MVVGHPARVRSAGGTPIGSRPLVLVFAVLVIIVVANNSAGSLAQPAIGAAFDAGPADVGWVVFGFGTTFAIGTAIWGGLARRFGIGRCLAVGVLLVAGGSILAAFAPSLPVVVAGRVVQGFGAGAIPTLSASAISLRLDGPDRARALGTIVASVGLGLAAGPILGGLALEVFGWQGPMAFGLVAAPAAVAVARIHGDADPTARIDVLGAALVAATVAAATFSLNRLPILGLGPITLASLTVLVIGIVALVRRSQRATAFVPRRIVTDPAFTRVVFLGSLGMVAFLGSLVLVPVAVARAHDLGGIALGLVLVPMAIVGAVASRRNASVEGRIGRRATTRLSLVSMIVGAAGLALLGASAPPPILAVALVPVGLAFGLLQAPLVNELSVRFDGPDRPLALGLYNLAFFLGGASGAAIATALLQAGWELPIYAGRAVPGFSTTLTLLLLAPLTALVLLTALRDRPATERVTAERGPADVEAG